jgi:virulence-associated protein VagC
LPKEFRFDRDEVSIQRVRGGVLLSTPETRVAALHAAYAEIDARRDPEDLFPYPPEPEADEPVSFDE